MYGSQNEPRIAEILSNLSSHLDMLAGQIFDVEAALSGIIGDGKGSQNLSITRLQALDFTRQSLEDCALLVEAISKEASLRSFVQDIEALSRKPKLAATKNLLADATHRSEHKQNGDVDLF